MASCRLTTSLSVADCFPTTYSKVLVHTTPFFKANLEPAVFCRNKGVLALKEISQGHVPAGSPSGICPYCRPSLRVSAGTQGYMNVILASSIVDKKVWRQRKHV